MAEEPVLTSPKISIIVPVYKVEQYLRRCLDSIEAQTFTDWECILIDDGSPDNSGVICDEYVANDTRFRVIHQENKGVSAARNAGLDVARGEWIGFVDSDDWIEPEMYEYLYEDLLKIESDCVVCGFYGEKRRRVKKTFSTRQALRMIFLPVPIGFGGYSVLRLISAEKIGNTRFDSTVSYMEDTKFFYDVFSKCSKVFWDNEPLYHYERRNDSVTMKHGLSRQAKSGMDMLLSLQKSENDKGVRDAIRLNYISFLLSRIHTYIVTNSINSEFYLIVKEIKTELFFSLMKQGLPVKDKLFFIIIENSFLLRIYLCLRKKYKHESMEQKK